MQLEGKSQLQDSSTAIFSAPPSLVRRTSPKEDDDVIYLSTNSTYP